MKGKDFIINEPLFYTTFKNLFQNLFKTLKLSCLEVSFAERCIWRKSTIRGRKAVKSHYLSSSKHTDTNHTQKATLPRSSEVNHSYLTRGICTRNKACHQNSFSAVSKQPAGKGRLSKDPRRHACPAWSSGHTQGQSDSS